MTFIPLRRNRGHRSGGCGSGYEGTIWLDVVRTQQTRDRAGLWVGGGGRGCSLAEWE
jgi:hypothetical protein